ncbi:Protein THEMIS2 [Dissostichus eleginoides]|uniref:Protein THEMIS2 n=1 Tax=Dissostichus eleginoides TaxID=100907 RepID=A0AAD9C931_DISEL|nr:Protein THEMIS2 [Dissostichus eleginoides]
MAGTTALPLQQFIASLDKSCLPKILQVCSGVYFQGSIYELSGNISNNEKFELPINHTGLFKVVPEEMPYTSVEEMVSLRPLDLQSCLPFTFTNRSKITVGNFTLGAGRALTVLSVERREGEFKECESEERFTLGEIMSSPCLCSRKFRFINTTKCERPLVLCPIFQVHAIMSMRKNVLKFPSSLEVDVVDATELCEDVNFVTPLSLTEVFSQPEESFPAVVEILEVPETRSLFKCSWLSEMKLGSNLIFHKKSSTAMVLLSSLKSRKSQQFFLVSQQYGGRLRRRPREFNSVYELHVASSQAPALKGHFVEVLSDSKKYKLKDLGKEFSLPLNVKVVSRDTELEADPLVGIACLRIEAAMLEPTIQASFAHRPEHCFEIPTEWLSMSVHFTKDPLPWPSSQPPKCHLDRVTEVTDMFFYEFRKQGNSDAAPPPRPPKRNMSSSKSLKTPSKPSKKSIIKSSNKSVPSTELATLTLDSKRRPPAPPPPGILTGQPPPLVPRKHSASEVTKGNARPNTYVQREESKKKVHLPEIAPDVDSDHDYEIVDETFATILKDAQDNVMFY